MADWVKLYDDYHHMTVAELKELLKSKGFPVSGKKKDLIQYLVFDEYPELFHYGGKFYDEITLTRAGQWLENKWIESLKYIFYAAINRQEI
tara:strand:- start:250 stop:522 length:273 start_codon:yes stop_codon:yes gene_type:complete